MGKQTVDGGPIALIEDERAAQTLLALGLLLEKVAAAVALHGQFTAARTTDTLLSPTM